MFLPFACLNFFPEPPSISKGKLAKFVAPIFKAREKSSWFPNVRLFLMGQSFGHLVHTTRKSETEEYCQQQVHMHKNLYRIKNKEMEHLS